jgi:hypothetical protein
MANTPFGLVRTAIAGLVNGSEAQPTIDGTGAQVVMDFFTKAILDGYGWQIRAGTITTPIVGDVAITDAAAEFCVDIANGGTLIPVCQNISIRLGTGTLHEYATKSVAGASSAGTAAVPLALKTGSVSTGLATARAQGAGAVTVTAETATTTLRHWSFSQPIAMGAYVPVQTWEPLRPPVLKGSAAAAQSLYTQIAATTTGPSYFANLDFLVIPTSLMGS